MANRFFSYQPVALQQGLFITRVITGLLLAYHGWEIADPVKMDMYTGWFAEKKYSSPAIWPWMGKLAELLAGLGLILGLFTRLACIAAMAAFAGIIFLLGDKGKIFHGDQHPFLFILLAMVLFCTGPGKVSVDHLLFKK